MQRPVEERDEFLRAQCAEEEELYLQVRDALDAEERMGNFLREPLINLATLVRPFEAQQVIADRFEILREIGEGGMGVVYEAFDRRLQQRIAIKAAKPGFQRLLSPELRGALHVRHENICVMNEIHTAQTQHGEIDFLTMEFLDGETLSARLAKVEKLPHKEALDIAEQLCAGVAAAHHSGILHRDLKCANVFLSKNEDGSCRAVIMDFGLATRMDLADAELGGTPEYMAPELWKGEPASSASDIYALGVVFYEMVAGRRPCGREAKLRSLALELPAQNNGHPISASRDEPAAPSLWIGEERWEDKQFTSRPLPPSAWTHGLDRRWDRVTMGCLAPSPAERPPDVGHILTDLKREPIRKWPFVTAALLFLVLTTVVGLVRPLRQWVADWIWPPNVRLAVLPFDGPKDLATVGGGALEDIAQRVQQLPSERKWPFNKLSRSVAVIPPSQTAAQKIDSPQRARDVLNATHTLQVVLRPEANGKLSAHASIVDTHSRLPVKEWSVPYQQKDVGAMSAALTHLLAMTFRLRESSSEDALSTAAMTPYLNGLYFLNRENHSYNGTYFGTGGTRSYDDAMAQFQQAATLDPTSALPPAGVALALVQKFHDKLQKSDLEQAQEFVRVAQSRNPDSTRVLLSSAEVSTAAGHQNRAVKDYRRILELEPRNVDALLGMADVYKRLEEFEEATAAIRKAQELDPDYYRPYEVMGLFYADQGRLNEAAEQFRKTVALAPKFFDGYSDLGAMLIGLRRFDEAEVALQKSLSIQETPLALNNMGALRARQGRFAEAAEYQRRALVYQPNKLNWLLNLADNLRWARQPSAARPYYLKGRNLTLAKITEEPNIARARALFAYFCARLGHTTQARQELKESVNLAPDDTVVLENAILTYEALGERELALEIARKLSLESLKQLFDEPDLADFCQDPRFKQLMVDKGGQ